jgi:hypothetical protein
VQRWLLAPGTRIAQLGDGWVAYSAQSGESHLLNDESVAVLGALDAVAPRTVPQICVVLAQEQEMPAPELEAILKPSWNSLVEAGLVREAADTVCL